LTDARRIGVAFKEAIEEGIACARRLSTDSLLSIDADDCISYRFYHCFDKSWAISWIAVD
jgi:hypothetical protein